MYGAMEDFREPRGLMTVRWRMIKTPLLQWPSSLYHPVWSHLYLHQVTRYNSISVIHPLIFFIVFIKFNNKIFLNSVFQILEASSRLTPVPVSPNMTRRRVSPNSPAYLHLHHPTPTQCSKHMLEREVKLQTQAGSDYRTVLLITSPSDSEMGYSKRSIM